MSRFLKNKRRIFLLCICICGFIILFTPFWILSIFLYLGVALLVANHVVIKKINYPYSILHANREIKQYANLVIGDFGTSSSYKSHLKEGNTLIITSPGKSLAASYQILLHVISCMEDEGNCIIMQGKNESKKDYTLFDIHFFNLITRKELGVEYLINRRSFPLLYEPIRSLRILFNIHSKHYKATECPSMELKNFCKRKGISLTYLAIYK